MILLPCHSLEDFPVHHEGEEAQGLLANWTALWHPALIAAAGAMPKWHRVDDPPNELADRLLVAPSISASELPTGFSQRAKEEGAVFIRKKDDRDEIIQLALEPLEGGDGGVDADLVADFLALGYCYLQVELLTRQMRYASNLDEVHFNNQVLAAAEAAMRGDTDEAKKKLTACFDVLAEERDHYYPVDAFIVDLTLVAETTIGASLREELARPSPTNLLLCASDLEKIASDEPKTLALLKSDCEQSRVGLIGGEISERRTSLLGVESLRAQLQRGLSRFEETLGVTPKVYGRRRFGLAAALPAILHKLGFTGALHATLDDGRFPEGIQIKTRWESSDHCGLDALARVPLDATKPETYLNLAVKMGESMDMDHVATICLAHWPGQSSPWLDDLRRIASYSSALGKFVTIDEYFRDTDDPGHADLFTADQYRSPYLKQAVIRRHEDPISSSVRYWQRRVAVEATHTLNALTSCVTGDLINSDSSLLEQIDDQSEAVDNSDVKRQIEELLAGAADNFAASLPRQDSEAVEGYLVANPCSFVRRVGVDISELKGLPTVERPVYAVDESGGTKQAIVDVPPMGFAWLAPGPPAAKKRGARDLKALAEDRSGTDGYYLLRNEFFEVLIDPTTGALRSLYEYKTRGNRLSYQLAFRLPGKRPSAGEDYRDADEQAAYSVMAADSIQVTSGTTTKGEIVVKGRLLDLEGASLAKFTQVYRVLRGSRIIHFEIDLEPEIEPRSDPWNSYFATRIAWPDEGADLWRGVNEVRQPVGGKRFEAPQYVEIESGDKKRHTTILTGGLPFHRKCGFRMLDSLLMVRDETSRHFELGVGIDVSHANQAALDFLAPIAVTRQTAATPSPASSSWLFHIDAKNVVATHWEPMSNEGSVQGFRVRLLETAGRSSRATLSCFRAVTSARQLDFQGQSLGDCKLQDGKVRLELSAGEWIELECKW